MLSLTPAPQEPCPTIYKNPSVHVTQGPPEEEQYRARVARCPDVSSWLGTKPNMYQVSRASTVFTPVPLVRSSSWLLFSPCRDQKYTPQSRAPPSHSAPENATARSPTHHTPPQPSSETAPADGRGLALRAHGGDHSFAEELVHGCPEGRGRESVEDDVVVLLFESLRGIARKGPGQEA
jgi:hypothetical protein